MLQIFDEVMHTGAIWETDHLKLVEYEVRLGSERTRYYVIYARYEMRIARGKGRRSVTVNNWDEKWSGTFEQLAELRRLLSFEGLTNNNDEANDHSR